jgi:hypothetical protein
MSEEVTLSGTSVHRLHSDLIDQDFLINVAVPPGYRCINMRLLNKD